MKHFLLLSALTASLGLPALGETAQQADKFVDFVGINTHLTYTNTAYYSQWPTILSSLQGSHIRHIRDGFYPWDPGSVYYVRHQQLHAAGIDCDFVVGSTTPSPEQVALVQQNAGDMAFLEAPNEVDDQKNPLWIPELQITLPLLYIAGLSSNVPVIGPSFVNQYSYQAIGDISPFITFNNLHVYFGGRNPGTVGWGSGNAQRHSYGSFFWWLDNANVDAPGTASIVTESGYLTNAKVTPYTLPQNIEAKYAPRTILEAFNAGVEKAYFYELVDEVSSPGYGMMDINLNPKLAYTAVSNLLGLLEDPGGSFQPGSLSYSLAGGDATLHHLLLQKRNGDYYLALWLEASGYNQATNVVTPVATQNVQLAVQGEVINNIYAMNDQGAIAKKPAGNVVSITIPVTDSASIVEIGAVPPAVAPVALGPTIANGTYGILNVASKQMIDDSGKSKISGTQMIQWKSNGGRNQLFTFTYQNGYYQLQNNESRLYLAASSQGTLIQQTLQTNDAQLWSVVHGASGWSVLNKATGRAIANPNAYAPQGVGVVMAQPTGGSEQIWTIQ